ncbi:MAG TPA: hypothetical protein EYP04_04880 [Anaerolineae bacterium]|nr:hypothetical protein [Anaerolineae bacterium]HIQ04810.1 hypothetical protein [Anaerolineae bacterium]
MASVDVNDLLARAAAATRVGELSQAQRLYEQAARKAPKNVQVWLGLAGVVRSRDAKRACFERALILEPDNVEAKEALALLTRRAQLPRRKEETENAIPASLQRLLDDTASHFTASTGAERTPVSTTFILGPSSGGDEHTVETTEGPLYCANHPNVETYLRCNKCGKPICMDCAVLTEVGYRCKECVRGQQAVFYTASGMNQLLGAGAALLLGVALGLAAVFITGFLWLWSLLVAPVAGGIVAEGVWRAAGRKRARHFNLMASALVILGAGPFLLLSFRNIFAWLFVALAVSTVYARLR